MIFRKRAEFIGTDAFIDQMGDNKSRFYKHGKPVDHRFIGDTKVFAHFNRRKLSLIPFYQEKQQFLFSFFQIRKAAAECIRIRVFG